MGWYLDNKPPPGVILHNFGHKKSIFCLITAFTPFRFPQGGNEPKTPSSLGESMPRFGGGRVGGLYFQRKRKILSCL
jgi:hypothetical protein